MGTPLRNISAILSPKFLSPLSGKNFNGSKSESRLLTENTNIHAGARRKLTFSQDTSKAVHNFNKSTIPTIKVEQFESYENIQKSTDILEINTPNKKDLLRSGLENFKCRTDILGKGKFGTVFKASYKGVTVAVKLIIFSPFLREQNGIFLNHKNIVKTIEIIKNPTQNFSLILMEYLPNCKDLQYVLENSNVTKLIKKFALDITEALKFCHDNNVLHLDLKPKNILVHGVVCKVCDFGNSVRIGEPRDLEDFRNNGTAIYTAPELLLGKLPTNKSDIYSLGVVLGQLKFGKAPFDGMDNPQCIIYNVVKGNLKPFANLVSESVDSLTKIVEKCLSTNPNDRPNVEEVLEKLGNM